MAITPSTLTSALAERFFLHLSAPDALALLDRPSSEWTAFATSWDRLGPDRYMADGGRYRRRRHATFEVRAGALRRKPHQPHFQSRDYNPLNGDVQRWFDPIEPAIADSAILRAIFERFTPVFDTLDERGAGAAWHSEVHQFRIETSPAELGRPTPEGLHRDGVDWVFVMLIARENVAEGVTEIGDNEGNPLGRFTLGAPGESVVLDDRRIRHGVTPIVARDGTPAHRDALVVTWRAD
ncbi:2OG-Fe dioxygenase family protein [Sphingomonas sp. H39-1-10]|uniref:2OG-Fe dioxygenase family protein n=1 Tax=Sphingomonas TaxID=13687 RepID=UPI00087E842A|nr:MULTISPECIES: 2OG-Fe dioxygenase family protein [Sphingomonas]MDF0489560.1 2OG-Fe dioxygenase family protein [Sphingomonas pollutisoli]SDA28580.1 hypothetical protein SAMN03159340_02226 [Sphingomonas sp. NFR15]